ncbi:hypothetical protein LCGC14_2393240, partial [marine sediment metagenome]
MSKVTVTQLDEQHYRVSGELT